MSRASSFAMIRGVPHIVQPGRPTAWGGATVRISAIAPDAGVLAAPDRAPAPAGGAKMLHDAMQRDLGARP